MKDVSGQLLAIGDKVAYCLGGKGTQMRVSPVLRITAKSVILEGNEMRYIWSGKAYVEKMEHVEVIRAFDAVSKIINQEGE